MKCCLYTRTTESYFPPLLVIKSATPAASAKVGMSRPIWLKVSSMLVGRARLSWAFDLSPMTMIGEEGSTVESLAGEPARGESGGSEDRHDYR